MKWTITEEEVDYSVGPDRQRITTSTKTVIGADRVEVADGNLLFYKACRDDDDTLIFATNHWDTVKLVTEE